MAIDPVCKMNVDPNGAVASEKLAGQEYFFCSDACHKTFLAEPMKYTSEAKAAKHSCCGGLSN